MTVQAVFRSTAPEVLTVQSEWETGRDQFEKFLDYIEAEFGRDALFTRAGATGNIVVGFKPIDEGDDGSTAPELRMDPRRKFLVPNKKTPGGAELAEMFQKNSLEKPKFSGMPEIAFDVANFDGTVHMPGTQKIGEFVYCTWECSEDILGDVDRTIWESVPLSEWTNPEGM